MNENLKIHDQLKIAAAVNIQKTVTEEKLEKTNLKNKQFF